VGGLGDGFAMNELTDGCVMVNYGGWMMAILMRFTAPRKIKSPVTQTSSKQGGHCCDDCFNLTIKAFLSLKSTR
jgi:hypothetical protein